MSVGESPIDRNLRLILDAELTSGRLTPAGAPNFGVRTVSGQAPPLPVRVAHRAAMKLGLKDGIRAMLAASVAIRRAALGDDAKGPPRFLVRVDEFPYATSFDQPSTYGVASARAFHRIMTEAGVPYLMAIVPELSHAPLDPRRSGGRELGADEIGFIDEMRSDGVEFGQHGVTHRTRFASPRRHSELGGLGLGVASLLGSARDKLRDLGVETRVLVPPFNRFDADQWDALAAHYAVITGGPESVPLVGARPSPVWWGNAVYLPCYPPLYADARTILRALDRVVALEPGCWVPIVLHTAWEADDGFESLRRLVRRLAPFAVPWSTFLASVDRSASREG